MTPGPRRTESLRGPVRGPSRAQGRPTNGPSPLHREASDARPRCVEDASNNHPMIDPSLTRARDKGIKDKDKRRDVRTLYDGLDVPYLLEELLCKYDVEFARTPRNERCVFCNPVYLDETEI